MEFLNSKRYVCFVLWQGRWLYQAQGANQQQNSEDVETRIKGGATPIDSIVTAATTHLEPVYEGRGGLAMHCSVYLVNS